VKIGIISPEYPSEKSHSYSFVHSRAKLYLKNGVEVAVFIISKSNIEYCFEGINVYKFSSQRLLPAVLQFKPDVLAIHYPLYHIISFVQKIQVPKVVWLHGYEILVNFRLKKAKNVLDYIKKRIVYLPREFYQKYRIRRFLDQVEYSVFVSKWMLKAAEKNTLKKYKNTVVIPNPVDTRLFKYKIPKNLNCAVSLRGFSNTKYGMDIAIKAFANLKDANLHLIGTGRLVDKYNRLANKINSNTKIIHKSFQHNEIPERYHEYGFFVAPSRAEAQGVAMCEAMSSGLPVIATKVGGIPEFVRHGIDGYLVPPNDPVSLRHAVMKLVSDKKKFIIMSKNARDNIEKICSEKIVMEKELNVLEKAIKKFYND
jgi:glycosyltransferase involved in cell wall biosynthesis